MSDILKLAVSLLLIVALLRRKLNIGYTMYVVSFCLAAMYLMGPADIGRAALGALTEPVTLRLVLALALIRMLEKILRDHEVLKEMTEAFKAVFRNRKAVIVSMPLLIGMLPSVGGAYFSAPMVMESTRDLDMGAEERSFINYWFRHPWEYILPLYPGILLASALSGIPLRALIAANLPYAALMLAAGFIFSMRGAGPGPGRAAVSRKGLMSFIPIAAVLALVMAFGLRLYVAIAIVVAGLLVFYRYSIRRAASVARHGFSLDVAVLITGVMLFKSVMEASGAVGNLGGYLASHGIPLVAALLVLPFVAGLLTGLSIGFVGATFPLLAALAGGDTAWAASLAFAAGFAGVLLSPVHVCLVLTREYFAADLGGIYRKMLVPAAMVLAAALVEYSVLSRISAGP